MPCPSAWPTHEPCCDAEDADCLKLGIRVCPSVSAWPSRPPCCTGADCDGTTNMMPCPSAWPTFEPCCHAEDADCLNMGFHVCPSMTAFPTTPFTLCCDPVKMDCRSTDVICPSMRPSFTSKPTPFPTLLTPRPSFSARPSLSVKPSIMQDVSRSAKPTTYPEPTKFIAVIPSALPSRWAMPTRRPLPSELPPLIQATLTFDQADPSLMTRPDKLQEIQINLGCVLRMPLENIQINAMYWMFTNGTRITIAFDASIPALKSNGTVQCLTKSAQRLRRVQAAAAAADGRIDVEYTVVSPSADIIALDSASYSALLTSSSMIQDLASSVGSTGVDAAAPSDLLAVSAAAGADMPATTGAATTESGGGGGLNLGASIGAGVGAAALVIAVAVIAYTVVQSRKHKTISAVSRHVQFIAAQPATQVVTLPTAGSGYFPRNQFNPMLARSAV
jgi:hypothetical protein